MNRYTNKDKQALALDPRRQLAARPSSTQVSRQVSIQGPAGGHQGLVDAALPARPRYPNQQRYQKLFSPSSPCHPSTSPTLIQLQPVKLYHSGELFKSSSMGLNLQSPPTGEDVQHSSMCLACHYGEVSKVCHFRKTQPAFQCLPQPCLRILHEVVRRAGATHGFPLPAKQASPSIHQWIFNYPMQNQAIFSTNTESSLLLLSNLLLGVAPPQIKEKNWKQVQRPWTRALQGW